MDVDDIIKLIEYSKESDKEIIKYMAQIDYKLGRIEGALKILCRNVADFDEYMNIFGDDFERKRQITPVFKRYL